MKKITLLMLIVFTITSQGQNKLLSSITENYNGSSWYINWGYNYEYDSNNNLISETYLSYSNGEWSINEKTIYTYTINNKVATAVYQDWNSTTSQFENSSKDTYTYNGSGHIIEVLFEEWENSQWEKDGRFTFTYNANNLFETGNGHSWDGTQWILDDRELYTYNLNNQMIGDFGETRVGSLWENDFKGTYSYTNNKITSFINENWSGSAWVQSEKTDYTIDLNGNRVSETNEYDSNSRYKTDYTYNTSSQLSSFAHPFADKTGIDYLFEGNPYVNKILSETQYSYDFGNSTYRNSSRTTYNYNSAITLSTKQLEIVNTSITVSPNPATSVVNLNTTNVTIDKVIVFDLTGRTVLQQEGSATQINVEKLTAGLYIIEAYSGNEKFTSKFIKK